MTTPSRIEVNVANDGATFVVKYDASTDQRRQFPFVLSPLERLEFSGEAGLRTARYEDPMIGGSSAATAQRLIGTEIVVQYTLNDRATRAITITGRLLQVDATSLVMASAPDNATTVIPLSRVVSVSGRQLSTVPLLVTDVAESKSLVVRGLDAQLSYSVHHSLLLEPKTGEQDAGKMDAHMYSFASVQSNYPWEIRVDRLTLTENERTTQPLRVMPERSEAPKLMYATMSAAPRVPEPTAGQSVQFGATAMMFPVTLANRAPTVVSIGTRAFPTAELHVLARSFDPTDVGVDECAVPLDSVVRLRRQKADGFVFSGPVSVLVDMDPRPGPDAVSGSLVAGFFFSAWEPDPKQRTYRNLGPTALVSLTASVNQAMTPVHKSTVNSHVVFTTLKFNNKTPYFLKVKHQLRCGRGRILRDVALTVGKTPASAELVRRVTVMDFVPELEEETLDTESKSMLVIVPPGESIVPLTVSYNERV